jgi:hypothetical protein
LKYGAIDIAAGTSARLVPIYFDVNDTNHSPPALGSLRRLHPLHTVDILTLWNGTVKAMLMSPSFELASSPSPVSLACIETCIYYTEIIKTKREQRKEDLPGMKLSRGVVSMKQ